MVAALQNSLHNLQAAIAQQLLPNVSAVKAWQRSLGDIQSLFQREIVDAAQPMQGIDLALQVEIDKQLKMLALDLTMLQAVKNEQTWQKRHQQVCDRLVLLQRYLNPKDSHP